MEKNKYIWLLNRFLIDSLPTAVECIQINKKKLN